MAWKTEDARYLSQHLRGINGAPRVDMLGIIMAAALNREAPKNSEFRLEALKLCKTLICLEHDGSKASTATMGSIMQGVSKYFPVNGREKLVSALDMVEELDLNYTRLPILEDINPTTESIISTRKRAEECATIIDLFKMIKRNHGEALMHTVLDISRMGNAHATIFWCTIASTALDLTHRRALLAIVNVMILQANNAEHRARQLLQRRAAPNIPHLRITELESKVMQLEEVIYRLRTARISP